MKITALTSFPVPHRWPEEIAAAGVFPISDTCPSLTSASPTADRGLGASRPR